MITVESGSHCIPPNFDFVICFLCGGVFSCNIFEAIPLFLNTCCGDFINNVCTCPLFERFPRGVRI